VSDGQMARKQATTYKSYVYVSRGKYLQQ